jgi:hypothetical protein
MRWQQWVMQQWLQLQALLQGVKFIVMLTMTLLQQ